MAIMDNLTLQGFEELIDYSRDLDEWLGVERTIAANFGYPERLARAFLDDVCVRFCGFAHRTCPVAAMQASPPSASSSASLPAASVAATVPAASPHLAPPPSPPASTTVATTAAVHTTSASATVLRGPCRGELVLTW